MSTFETGSATSPTDLLDKLRVFCETNGWTINRHSTVGLGKELLMTKSGCFVNFRSLINEPPPQQNTSGSNWEYMAGTNPGDTSNYKRYALLFNGSTSFDNSKDWWRQPGAFFHLDGTTLNYKVYHASQIYTSGAIPGYTFVASGNCIYIVIEQAAGYFEWGMFGTMNKIGSWTGGAFYSASGYSQGNGYPSNNYSFFGSRGGNYVPSGSMNWGMVYIGDTVDGVAPGWRSGFNLSQTGVGRVFDSVSLYKPIWDLSPNVMNQLVTLYPIHIYLNRDSSNNTNTPFSPIGTLPNIYLMNLRSLVPATDYSVGIESFRVFPFQHKDNWRINEYTGSYNSQGALGFGLKSN